jgi:hypothetical protein
MHAGVHACVHAGVHACVHAGVHACVHAAVLYQDRGHSPASRTELGTTKAKRIPPLCLKQFMQSFKL